VSRLLVTLQYLLPHHLLCRLVFAATRVRWPAFKNRLIATFCRFYHPDMSEAAEPDPLRYESFNAFFTRALKSAARPIDPDPKGLVSPCDGTLSVAATLDHGRMLQAKGHWYSTEALLAAPVDCAASLRDARYATIYLAPYNYHRLHMPLRGRLHSAWHVPGRVFSVNQSTVARVPGLFARNERVVCVFDGETGPFVLVLVGALFVGSMSTVWHGDVTPWRGGAAHAGGTPGVHRLTPTTGADAWLTRGAEFARFNMGSTIVMLMPSTMGSWATELSGGTPLRFGQRLGCLT
jgi:phosphatidylserine decarboxylase